ncbi:hypothetical protein TNCV_1645231 [Trichonephila clavipes]|nr:hypothetical protein TNCV_1645231 [Trichonephila clavipes]
MHRLQLLQIPHRRLPLSLNTSASSLSTETRLPKLSNKFAARFSTEIQSLVPYSTPLAMSSFNSSSVSEPQPPQSYKARKLLVPQLVQTYAKAAKPSIVNNSTQTDKNITQIKCPPLNLLQPVPSLSKPNILISNTAISTSSSSTQAELLPPISAKAATFLQPEPPIPMSNVVLSNMFTSIVSTSLSNDIQPPSTSNNPESALAPKPPKLTYSLITSRDFFEVLSQNKDTSCSPTPYLVENSLLEPYHSLLSLLATKCCYPPTRLEQPGRSIARTLSHTCDHFPVIVSHDYDTSGKTFPPTYSYNRPDWALFTQLAMISDAMVKTESVDTAVQEVTNVLIAAADLSIPKN